MGSERLVTGYLTVVQADCPNAPNNVDLIGPEVTFGRGVGNTVIWESLQVSRRHAVMEYRPDTHSWHLKDTSTNGMLLNNHRVPRNVYVDVKDQDLISFVPTGSLTYRFNLVGPASRPFLSPATESPTQEVLQSARKSLESSILILDALSKSPPKRKTGISKSQENLNLSPSIERKRKRPNGVSYEFSLSSDEELCDIEEPHLGFCVDNKIPVITSSSNNTRNKMDLENVSQGSQSEQELRRQLKLYEERIQQLELEKYEKDKRIKTESDELKLKLQAVQSENRVFQDELFKKVLEVMEHEYSCCICNEIFIQATVVDCGHTFCAHCISEWVKRKNECPNCRKPVKIQARHTEMENFIIKFHSMLPEEHLSKRNEVVADRKKEADAAKAAAAARNQPRHLPDHMGFAYADRPGQIADFLQTMMMHQPPPNARVVLGGGMQDLFGPDVIQHQLPQPMNGPVMGHHRGGGMYHLNPNVMARDVLTAASRRATRTRATAMPNPEPQMHLGNPSRRTRASAAMPVVPPPHNLGAMPMHGRYAAMDVLTVD